MSLKFDDNDSKDLDSSLANCFLWKRKKIFVSGWMRGMHGPRIIPSFIGGRSFDLGFFMGCCSILIIACWPIVPGTFIQFLLRPIIVLPSTFSTLLYHHSVTHWSRNMCDLCSKFSLAFLLEFLRVPTSALCHTSENLGK